MNICDDKKFLNITSKAIIALRFTVYKDVHRLIYLNVHDIDFPTTILNFLSCHLSLTLQEYSEKEIDNSLYSLL